ncbi:putative uncharacterized protein ENSP00000383407, partial [Neophocaena asiaeorientalis asiaeorientalis]|uniref:Uncharacterized protein n=1 Tax=Neophocaena asiaeorientalis asiaeorientalis TaxID=1706337 RepID=A0A341A9H5_NEOAA
EVSHFENAKPERKSIRRSMSESRVFEGKTVNDTTWQEPSKPENDSHIRRLCQLKDLNEDDFLLSNNRHTLQGRKLQGISYQFVGGPGLQEKCSRGEFEAKPAAWYCDHYNDHKERLAAT